MQRKSGPQRDENSENSRRIEKPLNYKADMSNKTNPPGSMYVNTGPVPYDHVPRCYVCGFVFGVDWEIGIMSANRNRRPCLGVYDANELINQTFWAMKPWWSFYRMSESIVNAINTHFSPGAILLLTDCLWQLL